MNSASPLLIAAYGTLFTFLCTTLGAAVVLFGRKKAGGSKDLLWLRIRSDDGRLGLVAADSRDGT